MKTRFWVGLLLLAVGAMACSSLTRALSTLVPTEMPPATTVVPSPTVKLTATVTGTPTPEDCGLNLECLIAAARACRPAVGGYALDLDLSGAQVHTVTQFDIHGLTEEGQCAFDVATVEVRVQFSEEAKQQMKAGGMSDQEIEAQRQMIEEQQRQFGPAGSCVGEGEALAAMLQRWQEGHFALSDWEPFTCTGGTLGQMGEPVEVTGEVTVEVTVEALPQETATPQPPQPTATATAPTGAYPAPVLVYHGRETADENLVRYRIGVANWQDYPAEWFQPAPHLPPCGQNPNAARAWVNIYDAHSGTKIYGFCALTKPEDLTRLWFAWPSDRPAPTVYLEIWDRATEQRYRSAPIRVGQDQGVATPTPAPTP